MAGDSEGAGMIAGMIVPIVVAGYFLLQRKQGWNAKNLKQVREWDVLTVRYPRHEIALFLEDFARRFKYKIEGREGDAFLVLTETISPASYGGYYPIRLTRLDDGSTQIEIGYINRAGWTFSSTRKRMRGAVVEQIRKGITQAAHNAAHATRFVPPVPPIGR